MKSTTKFSLYAAHESVRAARTALLATAGEGDIDEVERSAISNMLRRLQGRIFDLAGAPADLPIRLGADNIEN